MDEEDKSRHGGDAEERSLMERLSWAPVSDYLSAGIPAVIPILGTHALSLVVNGEKSYLGLRIPDPDDLAFGASPYTQMTFAKRIVDKNIVMELSTEVPELFFGFFLFCMSVVRNIEDFGLDYVAAVQKSLVEFGRLLSHRPLIAENDRLGLFGELWLLCGLMATSGVEMFRSWLGPLGERHDFRFGNLEVEVKSTTKSSRTHVINGLDQLVPSPGRSLFILSLQLERSGQGAGETLPGQISAVRSILSGSGQLLGQLNSYLFKLGFHEEDVECYPETFGFRNKAVLVPVDESCPSLTRQSVRAAIGGPLCDRLVDAEYVVNLDGLGFAEGCPEFDRILPGVRSVGGSMNAGF